MKRFTLILTGVLALQIVLAVGLTLSGSDYAAFEADEPLLAFDAEQVDQISIDESGGSSVTLRKDGDDWLIPEMAEFPASDRLVASLLDNLTKLEKGWPVATTSEAASRFKVSEDSHERRIVLMNGDDELATLFIGTAPTFKKAHVRTAGGDEIYAAEISSHMAGTTDDAWMDRDYLDIRQDKIASIAVNDVMLEEKDGTFTLAGDLKDGETLKNAEIPPVVSAVASPSFDVVQGKGEDALAKVEPADFEVTVKRKAGEPVVYKYKKEEGGGAYLFASSEKPYVFRVAAATIKPIVEAKREKFVEVKAEAEPKEDEPKPEAKAEPTPAEDAETTPQSSAAPQSPAAQPQTGSTGG